MTLMNCPIHNLPFKLIPAGISKTTGKPYNAFYACPERGCKEKPPKDAVISTPEPTPSQTASAPVPSEVWEAKDRLSAAQTSINAAAAIFQGSGDLDAVLDAAPHLYDFLRQAKTGILQKPAKVAKSDAGRKIQKAISEAEKSTAVEDEIKAEDIPF
jgi:hypothetical protein